MKKLAVLAALSVMFASNSFANDAQVTCVLKTQVEGSKASEKNAGMFEKMTATEDECKKLGGEVAKN